MKMTPVFNCEGLSIRIRNPAAATHIHVIVGLAKQEPTTGERRASKLPLQLKGSAPMANNTRTPRAVIRNQALLVIGKAERAGVAVRTLVEAKRIAEDHPDSGMTVEEIAEEIFKLAVERRLSIDPSC